MNAMERVVATLNKQEVDRIPVYPILAGITRKLVGATYEEWSTNADICHKRDFLVMVHNCGEKVYFDAQIQTMNPCAISFLHVPDDCKDFDECKEKYGSNITLIGCVPPPMVVLNTDEEWVAECKKQIDTFAKYGGYMLATGCEYPSGSDFTKAKLMIDVAKPHLVSAGVETKGTAVLGTVKGDLHDIGKNLVKMMPEGKGLNVIDLGVDVPADTFIEKAKEHNAKVICCSALLTTMGEMKNVVEKATEAGIRDKVKIMVGGAPITQNYCDSIGADYYTPDAASASDVALKICTE